jgi:poly(A) polymerase
MIQFLRNENLYESNEEATLREEILGKLDDLAKRWVKGAAKKNHLRDELLQDANAKIYTFGSYRLGVHGPGA